MHGMYASNGVLVQAHSNLVLVTHTHTHCKMSVNKMPLMRQPIHELCAFSLNAEYPCEAARVEHRTLAADRAPKQAILAMRLCGMAFARFWIVVVMASFPRRL